MTNVLNRLARLPAAILFMWRVRKLMKPFVPASPSAMTPAEFGARRTAQAEARLALWNLTDADEMLAMIADETGTRSPEQREALWERLVLSGAGQWTHSGYVPVLAFADLVGFAYMAHSAIQPLPAGWDEHNRWLHIAYNLVRYFNQEIRMPAPLPAVRPPE